METCAVMVVPCPERAAAAPAGPAAPGRPARRCPRRVGTATARAAPGRPATIGGPSTRAAEPGGDAAEPGAAGLGDRGVADRFGAVGPPHQQLGRQRDLGDLAVSAAGPPRGHGHGVGSDAADGAGATVPERAQHTPNSRARPALVSPAADLRARAAASSPLKDLLRPL